ncbi:hypothetical protein ACFXG4_20575 [Nocardia sp. NPDC059246]|uniref:hypothetical protein n=1 Tax=unclassified Nocardia TaxID=2637762 RepID=UPI0036CB9813
MTQPNPSAASRRVSDGTELPSARPDAGGRDVRPGKNTTPEERLAVLAARGPHLMLWSAATRHTFTVCRPDRAVIWHARFHADLVIDDEMIAAKVAALQAIWIAARARQEWGADIATLRLTVAQAGVERGVLETAAISSGLILDLVVDACANPALDHPEGRVIDWWTRDLGALIHNPQGLI